MLINLLDAIIELLKCLRSQWNGAKLKFKCELRWGFLKVSKLIYIFIS